MGLHPSYLRMYPCGSVSSPTSSDISSSIFAASSWTSLGVSVLAILVIWRAVGVTFYPKPPNQATIRLAGPIPAAFRLFFSVFVYVCVRITFLCLLCVCSLLMARRVHVRCAIPRRLESLAAEACKYDSFEDFSRAFSFGLMRGQYWHVTDDPNFSIRRIAPRDLSSLSHGEGGEVGLMVSYTPELWASYFPNRRFAAEIDLSRAVPGRDYVLVNRGFGHEVFVKNLDAVRVKRVVPVSTAIRASRYYNEEVVPQSEDKLFDLWRSVRECGFCERRGRGV